MNKKTIVRNFGLLFVVVVIAILTTVPVFAAAPVILNQTLSIAEDSVPGDPTTPNKVNAFDPEGKPLSYTIVGGTGIGIFSLDETTGIVTLAPGQSLDYESIKSYTLSVRVQDPESLASTAVVTINVTDASDESPTMNDQTFSVPENSANGTQVGKIVFSDLDVNDSHTFTINSGNGGGGGAFQIANNSGIITVKDSAQLNFETTPQFVLNVTITDVGNHTDTADITINVTNLNEKPNVSDQQFTISEDAANGSVVGTVVATDPEGDTLTFARTGGSTAFAINSSSGQVTVADNTLLDFETNPAPTFVVTALDTGGQSDTATITVNLTDVNDPPRVTGGGIPDLFPNEGTTIATRNLWAAFEDDEDDDAQLSFIVQNNDNPGLFSSLPIPNNSTGILTLNFAAGATGIANLTVRAFDTNGAFVDDTFKIDFNEAPVALGYANVTVLEDADNTVFSLYTGFTDAEQPSSELTYTIKANSNPGLFTSVNINPAGELVLDYALNANGQANITIRATDGGGLSAETTFNVKVNAVNDKPTTSGIPNVNVLEDATNTVINLASHFDDLEDGAGGMTYAVQSNSNAALFDSVTISATTLTLDYKADAFGTATIVVRATDNGNSGQPGTAEFVESTFTVTITSVNDKPLVTSFEKNTQEDIPVSFTLSDFSANFIDADGDPLSSVRIQSLPANGTLKLNGVNVIQNQVVPAAQLGTLAFVPAPNWDTGTTSFEWTASDGLAYAEIPATVTISVQPVNDQPTVTNIEKTGPEGVNINFTKEDFILAFADVDGQTLQVVRIASAPQHGTLKRGNVDVNANDQISVELLDQLRYVPNQYFNGVDSFSWTGSDGSLYASPAQVILTLTPENDPPVLDLNGPAAGVDSNATFAAGSSPVAITSQNLTITDVDNDTMASATVLIVGLKNGSKEKLSADTTGTSILASYSVVGSNGLLQLTGTASIADYEKVLKTVKFGIEPDVTNPDTTTRNIQFIVYDGQENSNDAFAYVDVINPRIKISITPEIQPVAKGGTAVFTVEVENVGNVALTNILINSAAVPGCSRTNYANEILDPGEKVASYACVVSDVQDRIDNKVVVTAKDVVVSSTVTADDTAIVRVLREMVVSVVPLASVGDVLLKGQDAKFTVTVINPSEVELTSVEVKAFVDYDYVVVIASPADNVPAPSCDKVIGTLTGLAEYSYDCTIPNVQASFQIEVQATGMIEGNTPTGDFDIDQISVLDMTLDVSSSHFQVPAGETTPVKFSLTLTNISDVPMTLQTLNSAAHGNLLDTANGGITDNNCPTMAKEIPGGEVRTCSYTVALNLQPPAFTNLITATAADAGSRLVTVSDSAIVSVGDFSALEVFLSASPPNLPAPGGTVNLTVRVKNNTPNEITLDELEEDNVTLDGQGNCAVPKNIPANGEYSCVYSATISNKNVGDIVTRTVMASAASLEATASVDIHITGNTHTRILLPSVASLATAGEPNNSVCSALQISPNIEHYFFADDAHDWYKFTLTGSSDVVVRLSDFNVTEGQMMVYAGNCNNPNRIGHNGDLGVTPEREIRLDNLAAGDYFIWVLSSAGLNTTSPYALEVDTTAP